MSRRPRRWSPVCNIRAADVLAGRRRRALPRLARPRLPLHAGHQLHLSRRTSVHDADFLYTSSRPARRRCTTATASRSSPTARSSTRRCSRRSAARRRSVNMECYIFQPGTDRATSSSTRCRSARGTASTSRSSSTRSAASACWGRPVRRLREAAAASSRISSCAGTRSRGSTTARTASCSSSTAASRSPAAPASPTGGRPGQGTRGRGATRWRASRGRSSRRSRAWRPRTGSSAAARSSPGPEYFPDLDARGRDDGVRRQELAVRSRDGVARGVSAADGGRRPARCASARRTSCPTARCAARSIGIARRGVEVTIDRARARRPISGGCGCASRRMWGQLLEAGVRIYEYRGTMMHAKVLDRRRHVVGARHDQHRQPIVRAQRRGQRRDAATRRSRRGCSRTTSATSPTATRSRSTRGARGRCGRRSSARSSGSWSGSSERAAQPQPAHVDLRVATYNIHRCRGMDRRVVAVAHRRGAARASTPTSSRCRKWSAPGRRAGPGRGDRRRARHGLGDGAGAAPAQAPLRQRRPQPLPDRAPHASTTCRGGRASRAACQRADLDLGDGRLAARLQRASRHGGARAALPGAAAGRLRPRPSRPRPEDHPRRLQRMDARAGDPDAERAASRASTSTRTCGAAAPTRASSRSCTSTTSTTRAQVEVRSVELPRTRLALMASDHLPLVAEPPGRLRPLTSSKASVFNGLGPSGTSWSASPVLTSEISK